jgi:tRNA (mo5U34)-methyltransferase
MPVAHTYSADELRAEVARYSWYHNIDLGLGVVTPGRDLFPVWDAIRETRAHVNYSGKKVLDLASFDGMWAFEAEKLGARAVVATDCNYPAFRNFLFCKEWLRSSVLPYFNVSPYNLHERLDCCFELLHGPNEPHAHLFDIVQHFGLLYHVRDPLFCLNQARSVTHSGGHLVLETAIVTAGEGSFMLFNGIPPEPGRIYDDITTWWAPSLACLKEMLRASLFQPHEETIRILPQSSNIGRVSLIAEAIGGSRVEAEYYRELTRTYRNPGLIVDSLER